MPQRDHDTTTGVLACEFELIVTDGDDAFSSAARSAQSPIDNEQRANPPAASGVRRRRRRGNLVAQRKQSAKNHANMLRAHRTASFWRRRRRHRTPVARDKRTRIYRMRHTTCNLFVYKKC